MSGDSPKIYIMDGATLTSRWPCKEDALSNEPSRSTQKTLDHLADNGILTSVVYGDKDAEENSDERYYSVTIFFRAEGRVSDPPKQATTYIGAVQLAYELALDLEWLE